MSDETQMGPLNSLQQLEVIEKNINDTVQQGGVIKCGGKRSSLSNKGYYFPATIIGITVPSTLSASPAK